MKIQIKMMARLMLLLQQMMTMMQQQVMTRTKMQGVMQQRMQMMQVVGIVLLACRISSGCSGAVALQQQLLQMVRMGASC
jgi:hypothetical protein